MTIEQPILVAYVPVLHQGYINWFANHHHAKLYLLSQKQIEALRDGHEEIRAVDPIRMADAIRTLGTLGSVQIHNGQDLKDNVIMPDEVISRRFAQLYRGTANISFESVYLRWDSASVAQTHMARYDRVTTDTVHRHFMDEALKAAENSIDWWRHVGAVVVRDGQVILKAHNQHVPSPELPYAEGDPRDFIVAGQRSELSTAIHCEQAIVAEAARQGISLSGCELYVNVFPCPECAKLIAYSGFREVFFLTGHASIDGDRILKDLSVIVTMVQL